MFDENHIMKCSQNLIYYNTPKKNMPQKKRKKKKKERLDEIKDCFFLKQKHIIYYSIKLASWNKTSLAIGGTSSIQDISSEIFLANWANT